MNCCICRMKIETEPLTGWKGGHNAQPIMDGRCCGECNTLVVIPLRLRRVFSGLGQSKPGVEGDA